MAVCRIKGEKGADTSCMEEIIISRGEAAEYAEFKRQKRMTEVCRLLLKLECDLTGIPPEETASAAKACKDGGFGFVRVNPLQVSCVRQIATLPVICVAEEVYSDLKTKVTAVRQAFKNGADEVVMTLAGGKEVKKEVKRLKKASRGKRICFRIGDLSRIRDKSCLAGLPIATAIEEDALESAKLLGGGTLTVEGAMGSVEVKRLFEDGADRVATADYQRVAKELFDEANRPEAFESSAQSVDGAPSS